MPPAEGGGMEISMNIKKNIIKKCPSDTHKQFLEYAFCFFQEKNCKAILKGSIQKDTAHKFSDIDLVLKRMDKELVREFIFNFGEVVLISRTQRPLGILIVIYSDGLCLDLDFRDKITREEINDCDVIGVAFTDGDIAEKVVRCTNILEEENTDDWENMQRLFHRSLIKWIGGNEELGYSILQEIYEFILNKTRSVETLSGDYKKDIAYPLREFNKGYSLDVKYYGVIEELIDNIR